jgi:hypothetical protein
MIQPFTQEVESFQMTLRATSPDQQVYVNLVSHQFDLFSVLSVIEYSREKKTLESRVESKNVSYSPVAGSPGFAQEISTQ